MSPYFPEAFGLEAMGLGCLVDISDRVKAQTMLAEVEAEFGSFGARMHVGRADRFDRA